MAMTTSDITTKLRSTLKRELNKGRVPLDQALAAVRREYEDHERRLEDLDRLNARTGEFTVTIEDTAVSAYSLGSEEARRSYTGTGLQATIEMAEADFARRFGAICTDGWVRYSVTTPLGGRSGEVPPSVWAEFTCQSRASLRKAKKH